jgi:hypothetical protein
LDSASADSLPPLPGSNMWNRFQMPDHRHASSDERVPVGNRHDADDHHPGQNERLLHAEEDQVHGLFIHCTQCGACNATAD